MVKVRHDRRIVWYHRHTCRHAAQPAPAVDSHWLVVRFDTAHTDPGLDERQAARVRAAVQKADRITGRSLASMRKDRGWRFVA
jgi:hypothetical protein